MMPPISNMTPAAAIVNLRPAFLLRYAAGMNFFIKAHQHAMRQTKHTVLAHHANAQAETSEDREQPHRAEHVQALHSRISMHKQAYARVHFYEGRTVVVSSLDTPKEHQAAYPGRLACGIE